MENTEAQAAGAAAVRRPYKRHVRNILIHKPMQREFTFVLIALLMISTIAIGFVIRETIKEAALGGGFQFGKLNPYELLSDLGYSLILRVSCILFITLLVIGTFGIFFLHRVAGPVYRFRKVFLKLSEGEIPDHPIKLREGDFFQETANEINRLMARMRLERERNHRLRQKVNELLSVSPADGQKLARELKVILEQPVDEPPRAHPT